MAIKRHFKKRRDQIAAQIAACCRQRRKELGWTQQVAALMAGIGWKSVNRIEKPTGENLASLDVLVRYADALGLSLADIFADEDRAA